MRVEAPYLRSLFAVIIAVVVVYAVAICWAATADSLMWAWIGLPVLLLFGVLLEVVWFYYIRRWGKFVVTEQAKK